MLIQELIIPSFIHEKRFGEHLLCTGIGSRDMNKIGKNLCLNMKGNKMKLSFQ